MTMYLLPQYRLRLMIILIMGLSFTLKAQEAVVLGKVMNDKRDPVIYATVVLRNQADSTIYKGEVTNESGEFIFQKVRAGRYYLQVQVIGYDILNKSGIDVAENSTKELGEIILSQSAKELKSVTIQGEKPFIERQTDKTVVNVENSIVQAGSTVMEVFEKLPGVIVDQDGNIRLRGKQGVIIMIDEKLTTLSGVDLVNMLRGMSASNIQKIEIITNPSAKWDAAGNAGILNIIMKKNRLNGFNGSANFTYGQGRYPKYNPSVSLNYKKDKLNLFFNYSYSNRKGFNNLIIDRKFYQNGNLTENFLTNNYIRMLFDAHNPRLGLDFSLSNKTTISVLATAFNNVFESTTDNHTDILGSDYQNESMLDFDQESKFTSANYEFNTQLSHKFDTLGQSVIVNLDYGKYDNNSNQYFTTLYTNVINNSSEYIYMSSNQIGLLNLYSLKVDYSKPLGKEITLEAGLKSSYIESDMDMRFYNSLTDVTMFDSSRSSHFIYSENINAAYVSLVKKIKSLTLQAGLRAEQTVADGLQMLNNQSFERDYLQLFPTLYVNYESGKSNFNANLGRRINRPGYGQMNPFRRMIDYTTYSEGNPYLLPELTYVTEFSYSYDNTYAVTLSYSQTSDNILDVLIQDAQTQTTIQSVVNLYQLNYYSFDFSFTKRLMNAWKTHANFLGYYSRFTGIVHDFPINQGRPSFSLNNTNNFTITDNLTAELSIRYNYETLYGVTLMRSNLNVSAGVQKTIWQKRGIITFNLTDIFWTAYPRGFTDFGDVTEEWVSKRDTRVLNLGLTYNFGKGKAGRMRRSTGADEEKSRVG